MVTDADSGGSYPCNAVMEILHPGKAGSRAACAAAVGLGVPLLVGFEPGTQFGHVVGVGREDERAEAFGHDGQVGVNNI